MRKFIIFFLNVTLLFSLFSFCASAQDAIDPLQKFFLYSLNIDGDSRIKLVDNLKLIKSSQDITPEITAIFAALLTELNETEINNVIKVYSQRSVENKSNIQDLILFGAKEMPFIENMPTISKSFNSCIIGNANDNRGINYFSTLIAVYNLYTLFGGDSTIAANNDELPGLIQLFVSEDMPKEVIVKISGALNHMPSLKAVISGYPGESSIQKLFSYAEQLVNDCPSNEIYYFKFSMDKLGVFEGEAADFNQNKKYPGITFRDVDSFDWATPQIQKLVSIGIINGMGRYIFAPESYITREQFVKLITGAFNIKPAGEVTLPFTDAKANEWYFPYLAAAYSNKIISGETEDYFGVGNSITREQMAVMIYRVCAANGISFAGGNSINFTDNNLIGSYAKDAINALSAHKIVSGVGNNIFAPQNPANRAEAAAMIYNIMNYAKLIPAN